MSGIVGGNSGRSSGSIETVGSDVVDDVTPQLGGDLDLNSNDITGSGGIPAANLTGSVPVGALGNVDLAKLEYNQAILAFKIASSNQLAKFSMVDQIVDEYQDATGIDAGNSTNELAGGSTTAKYYEGAAAVSVSASGGTVTTDGAYTIHTFLTTTSTKTFVTDTAQDVDYLVIGGGGGGGGGFSDSACGGGGGAGAYRTATGFAVPAASYSISIGALGAAGAASPDAKGGNGGNSVFSSITSNGGAGGGTYSNGHNGFQNGNASSSGGGGGGAPASGTQVAGGTYGNNGGEYHASGASGHPSASCGGGGGSGGNGGNGTSGGTGGAGGAGTASSITGSSVVRAGGGGGGAGTSGFGGAAGTGGAGAAGAQNTNGSAATATTGSGGGGCSVTSGGGGHVGGAGATGVVIIRRPTSGAGPGGNLTLQSVAATAESAPTTADLVVLIEDNEGTATINTDIKGKVSRDGSAFSGYVTFVDEGDWGTNKRILVARNIDISGITSGVAMKYKLETLNQGLGSKETRIHATSLAWN